MRKINKKISIGIASILSVFVLAVCLFGIVQNKQNDNTDINLIATPKFLDSVSQEALSNEVTYEESAQGQGVVANKYEAISNSADNPREEAKAPQKDNPNRCAQLFTDDMPAFSMSLLKNGIVNENDAAYKLENKNDETKKLTIGPVSTPGFITFDSTTGTPWVDENQYLISEVEVLPDTAPHATTGWFGCQTKAETKNVRLSDIKTITGLSNLDMINVEDASYMFCGSDILDNVEGFPVNWKSVTNADGICNYTNLNNEFLNNVAGNIANTVSSMYFAFANNFKENQFTTFEINDADCKVTNARYMFYKNNKLETINANKLISDSTTDVTGMFRDCSALTTITLDSGTDWSKYSMSNDNMFLNCNSLVGGNGTSYAGKKIANKTYAKTDGGESNPGYFTAKEPKSTIKFKGVDGKNYYPVFSSVPEGTTFYNANETKTYTTMSSEIDHAVAPKGTEIIAVRDIKDVDYNSVYGEDGTGPKTVDKYWAQTNLVTGESVEKLTEKVSPSSETDKPKINNIELTTICKALNPEKSSDGFGGSYGPFWSCVAIDEDEAWYWASYRDESGIWVEYYRDFHDDMCVCVSRVFN